jgi:hypothetical protein
MNDFGHGKNVAKTRQKSVEESARIGNNDNRIIAHPHVSHF